MADSIWNIREFEGLSSTTYITDARAFDIGQPVPRSTATGTGTVSVFSDTNTPPRFELGNGAGAGTSEIRLTPSIFSGRVSALMIDVEGYSITKTGTSNPNLNLRFGVTTVGTGLKQDDTNVRLWCRAGGGTERSAVSLAGNVYPIPFANLGVMVDYINQRMVGHIDYAMTAMTGGVPATAGTPYNVTISNSGDTENKIIFEKIAVTVIWKTNGSNTEVVFNNVG